MKTGLLIKTAKAGMAGHKKIPVMNESVPSRNKRFERLNIPQSLELRRDDRDML